MRSLRLRLFALVAAVTMLVWAGAAAWTAVSTRAQLERVLDRRLVEAARMVAALDVPVSGRARALPSPSLFISTAMKAASSTAMSSFSTGVTST